jgi:MYXO-CTERM domain-containing protein
LALKLEDDTTSHHFRVLGNLFIGPDVLASGDTAYWSGGIDDGLFDSNGWWPDGGFDFGGLGDWSGFSAMQAAGPFESHGRLLSAASPFQSGMRAPDRYTDTVIPADVALASGTPAIDASMPLLNVNDVFLGVAPDLGAVEQGCASPTYGVRAVGVDETDFEPCGDPADTDTDTDTDADTDADSDTDTDTDSGIGSDDAEDLRECGCSASPSTSAGWAGAMALMGLCQRRRRR